MEEPVRVSIACDGRCCEPFVFTDENLEIVTRPNTTTRDGPQVLDMLEFTEWYVRDYGDEFELESGAHFRCRNFDQETRKCRIYESRPAVCASYPDERACQHCGATAGASALLVQSPEN